MANSKKSRITAPPALFGLKDLGSKILSRRTPSAPPVADIVDLQASIQHTFAMLNYPKPDGES